MTAGSPEQVMQTYRATVAYDGTRYKGFQVQKNGLTIQGEIERSLRQITQQFVRIAGAGRTDAGVHAQGQVISFESAWRHGPQVLERAMNAVLPPDIAVRELGVAPEGFHARFGAVRRVYVYSVYVAAVRSPMLDRYAMRLSGSPLLTAMQQASQHLVGEHDFAAMGQPPVGEQTVRHVYSAQWEREPGAPHEFVAGQVVERLRFVISANGFLRGMVRRVVGTLLEVGASRMVPDQFADLIASKDISAAAPPALACGLVLWRVDYDKQDAFRHERNDAALGR